jgi:hypothetical protein
MKIQDTTKYGTQLEFRLRGEHQILTETFWGTDHGLRSQEYLNTTDLFKRVDYHRFVPVSTE